jgi:trans-aconitate 2-methyltransferase
VYEQILTGDDPVLEWVRGTGLRPVLAALDAEAAARFEAQYAARLREAYPAAPYGTVFGFARTFVVARKP